MQAPQISMSGHGIGCLAGLQRHSDQSVTVNNRILNFASSSPPATIQHRLLSAPVTPSGESAVATSIAGGAPSPFRRYGTGGGLWYSQSQSQRRAGNAGESALRAAKKERAAATVLPRACVMKLMTRVARVLQNETLMSSLGPAQDYFCSFEEASSGNADDGVSNDQHVNDQTEKTERGGCITC